LFLALILVQNAYSQSKLIWRMPLAEQAKTTFVPRADGGFDLYVHITYAGNDMLFDFLEQSGEMTLSWNVQEKPEDNPPLVRDSVVLSTDNLFYNNKYAVVKITLPKIEKETAFMSLRFKQTVRGNRLFTAKYLNIPTSTQKNYTLLKGKSGKLPYMANYCSVKDSFLVQSSLDSVLVRHFMPDSFPLPPMFTGDVKKPIRQIRSFWVKNGHYFAPNQAGSYIISAAEHQTYIYSTDIKTFPQYTKAKDLLKPLHYISTDEEVDTYLKKNKDFKLSLDDYLLTVHGTREQSRRFMKSYFQRVTLANELFSSSAEGWQTDKGMIFIIFGMPDRVYQENNAEDWSYEKNALYNELNFYFTKADNYTKGRNLHLERLGDYKEIWYGLIDKWRKGLIR
jgi:GWxTD domain-containing protein